VVPEEAGGDGAVGAPGLREGVEFGVGGARGEALDLVGRGGEGEVAGRPHVGAPERHQQVDVRRPRADAFDLQQLGARLYVAEAGEPFHVQLTRFDE
jgi:hypothetical protein